MSGENFCNTGKCPILKKTGDNKHPKHLNEPANKYVEKKDVKIEDKDDPLVLEFTHPI